MIDWLKIVGAVLGLVAFLTVIVWAIVADRRKRRECEDKGGKVERYNCHLVTNCHTDANGWTSCTTHESCSWRCVGLPAEDPR